MRHTLFIITAMALMALPIYAKRKSEGRVVSSLTTIWNNSTEINVAEIEYSADATTLTFQTTRDCGPKLKIGHGIYIVDDQGVRHHAISTDGIKLDSLYVVPKGEKRRFTINFTPVAEDNKALDLIVPDTYIILGLHDKSINLVIPEPNPKRLPELSTNEAFIPQNVTIEGTIHDAAAHDYTSVFADYDCVPINRPSVRWEDKFAMLDGNGHFKLTFPVFAPQEITLFQNRFGGRAFGNLYVRPGDVIQLDLYDSDEGKKNTITNLNGRHDLSSSSNFLYMPGLPEVKYLMNYQNDFKDMSFEESAECLEKDYRKALQYAKYTCWHNNMDSYDSRVYLSRIKAAYIKRRMNALAYAEIIATRDRNPVDEVTKLHFLSILNNADLTFLKELEPDDYVTNYGLMMNVDYLIRIGPIAQIINSVPETAENRWQDIINLQNEKLKQITGWEDWNSVMQGIIICGYRKIHKSGPMPQEEYRKMKELITHPFWAQELEGLHQRYS